MAKPPRIRVDNELQLDTKLESERPTEVRAEGSFQGWTHLEVRLHQRCGAANIQEAKELASKLYLVLKESAPEKITLNLHGGSYRAIVEVEGIGFVMLWRRTRNHRTVIRTVLQAHSGPVAWHIG